MADEEALLLKRRDLLVEKRRLMAESASHIAPKKTPVNFMALTWAGRGGGEALGSIARNTGEPFNRGVAGLLDLPVTAVNLATQGIYAADRMTFDFFGGKSAPQMLSPFQELGKASGLIAPEEEQRHGLIPRTFEFVGAGVVPEAAILNYGSKALAALSPVPSALQQMGRISATNPGTVTAFGVASNFSAAAGGTVARANTDNETIIAMSELGLGFLPSAIALVPQLASKFSMAGRAWDKVVELSAPYSESGAMISASNRLQDVAQDAPLAANRLSKASIAALEGEIGLPPALITEDPQLIKLQNMVFARHPAMAKKYTDELNAAIEALTKGASFGGDTQRARHILNVRAQQAVEDASIALAALGPNATPRQVSSAVRKSVQKALDDSIAVESRLWESLDSTAPGELTNAKKALEGELATRSMDADPDDIPGWILAKLGDDPIDSSLMKSLDRDGWIGVDGKISPALMDSLESQGVITKTQRSFNDIKAIRTRVGGAIAKERGEIGGGNRNKIRILSEIQEGLLNDLEATGVAGAKEARQYSAALNERYRRGRVGSLLGFDKTGAERVAGEDLLQDVVFGRHSATNTQKLIEMSSEAPEQTISYIKGKYIESVYGSNLINEERRINTNAHRIFVENLQKEGMFELFPGLEVELHNMRTKGVEALKLDTSGSSLVREHQSRAALLLKARPEDEMAIILNSDAPALTARSVVKRMHDAEMSVSADGKTLVHEADKSARQGLKTSFFQEILKKSGGTVVDKSGRIVPDGQKALALLKENKDVMHALGMTAAEQERAIYISNQIRIAQGTAEGAGNIGESILNIGLARPIEIIARIMGARTGAKLGGGSGGSIQTAGILSKESKDRLLNLTTSKAEELVVMAFDDPSLMEAMLVGPRSGKIAQLRAERRLNKALMRLTGTLESQLAIAVAQSPELWEQQE